MKSVNVAIGQYGSIHLDLELSLLKLEKIVNEAADRKVDFLAMGETWLSGYPAWLDHCPDIGRWDYEPMKKVYLRLYESSITIPGKEFNVIASLAKKYSMTIAIGVNEKVNDGMGNGTIYNSSLLINDSGELLNHHRKLMPTFTEKLLYGQGDAVGLISSNTPFGRVGGSICWEHWMPLCRQALHDSGEHIHVSLWPTVNEMHQVASRSYAFEGRCFVLAAGQILSAKDFPNELVLPDYLVKDPSQLVLRGGSCVIGPDGNFLVQPVFDKEQLITIELDLDSVYKERMTLDTSGHYQRRDIFDFEINRKRY
ncbi:MAG: carbon-nitrogen hydrolase family protein [Bacteroidetes bacterium]|nr:carbon-nitrogen hydrolase family protein [Bacteroidota bacterium]